MQWLINIVQSWIVAQGYLLKGFVDRGDPGAADFVTEDLTKDALWHDLDLSDIIPAGAKAVALSVLVRCLTINKACSFQKKGNVNDWNRSYIHIAVSNQYFGGDLTVPLPTDRKIQYNFATATWPYVFITVKGWWF